MSQGEESSVNVVEYLNREVGDRESFLANGDSLIHQARTQLTELRRKVQESSSFIA